MKLLAVIKKIDVKRAICVFAALCFVQAANARCKQPIYPKLPEAESAVLAQMMKAKADVKKYMSGAEKFLGCSKNKNKLMRVEYDYKKVSDEYMSLFVDYKQRMITEQDANSQLATSN